MPQASRATSDKGVGGQSRSGWVKTICGAIFLLSAVFSSASAQIVASQGSAGTLTWPVTATNDTVMTLDGAQISVDAPSYFNVQASSIKGPVSIAAGQTQNFTVDYLIGTLPQGTTGFTVNLHLTFGAPNVAAKPRDTSVMFILAGPVSRGEAARETVLVRRRHSRRQKFRCRWRGNFPGAIHLGVRRERTVP
jgi:hypothetical protein